MEKDKKTFTKVSLTAHDGYIGISWETAEEHGEYEFEKNGSGWRGYSTKPDEDLGFLQELIQATLNRIDFEE